MRDEVDLIQKGGHMFDSSLLKKYRGMSDGEKIQALTQAIHMDEKPLMVLLAMLAILEPERVECVFSRLSALAPESPPVEASGS